MNQLFRSRLLSLLCMGMASLGAAAQSYPDKPITLIVGYPAGGSTDATGRAVAEGLAKALKATVVVENLGGAGGVIAAKKVIAAKPDGYTLLVGANNELAIAPLVSASARYNAVTDLTALGLIASQPMVFVTTAKTGVTTMDQFIESARSQPGKLNYGSSGVGSALHLTGELVEQKAGVKVTHVPYRGVAPMLNDLLGGNLDYGYFVQSSILPHIQSGKVVPLAVSESTRSPLLPQVPTLSEHPKLTGAVMSSWFMLMAPKNLPEPIKDTLSAAFASMLKDSALRKRLEDIGSRVATGTENAAEILSAEIAAYRRIVDSAKIRLDE